MTTAVPPVVFGPNGFVAPPASAVLAGTQADIAAAFALAGYTLNPALNTPQGQIATTQSENVVAANDTFVSITNQVDPAFAQGRMQDAIGRIYFIERMPAEPTVLQVACLGAAGVVIPVGALVVDPAGNIYNCSSGGTIPAGGSVTLAFANNVPGPTAIPETLAIYQAVPGWDSATVSSGALGNDVEGRAAFETRRAASVAGNSFGAIGSILGAVSGVSGVLDYWGYDNGTAAPVTVLGVTVPANSIYVAAVGGTQATVAKAIFSKKAPGCSYYGNTSVVVQDTNPLYGSNPPSYTVEYETPSGLQFLFAVNIVSGAGVPSNAATLIQDAIVAAFAGSDGGPRPRIASLVLASRFVAPVTALGPWAQVRSLQLGSNNNADAVFTASIATTNMTVAAVASGTIEVGGTISDSTGAIVVGTTVVSQTSGPAGGAGVYVVSNSQTVSGAAFTGTAGSPSTHLVATAVTGTINIGDTVIGTGITTGTTILSQVSGTPGGAGTYNLSAANTASGASLTTGETVTSASPTRTSVQVQANQEPEVEAANVAVTVT